MTTPWTLPTIITQYPEEGAEDFHVSWLEKDNFSGLKYLDGKSIQTSRDLLHIARDPRHDIIQKTYFLKITGFNFENIPDAISGIELKLSMNRFGRITDETVQLCLDDSEIGDNQASLTLDPIKTYGGENTIWGATALTKDNLQTSSFGVIIRFQSHPMWPHRNSALIDAVELRIH